MVGKSDKICLLIISKWRNDEFNFNENSIQIMDEDSDKGYILQVTIENPKDPNRLIMICIFDLIM